MAARGANLSDPERFGIHPGTKPGRVRLRVSDLDGSLAFYERVLGLRVIERSGGRASLGAHALAGAEGAGAPLVELDEESGVAPVPPGGRPGLYHYALLLPDRSALGRFVRHLTDLGERPGAADHGVSEALYLSDPDGLGIEVYRDRPRSEWRRRDGQLLMTTEPLDLAAVAGAAEGEAWSGMPPGTRIGHVHLHVGDLDRAASFYEEALGLDRTVWSYPGALFLAAGEYHHHLGLNTWATAAGPAGEGDARLLEWELTVPSTEDADGVLRRLEGAGHPVERSGRGGVALDPWGIPLGIRAPEAPAPGA